MPRVTLAIVKNRINMCSVVENVIASQVYALNKSKSKFAVVGLAPYDADNWRPRIFLCGQYWSGVSLTVQEWCEFGKLEHNLRAFFNGGQCDDETQISRYCTIFAKQIYNKPAVVVEVTDGKTLLFSPKFSVFGLKQLGNGTNLYYRLRPTV